METAGAIDWTIMGLYLAGVVALGCWLGKGQTNTRDYFLGSRSIPWWGVSLSIIATETSALTFIGVPAIAYGSDLAFLQIVIGYVLARIVLSIFFVPCYFRGEIYSPYQLLADAFGPNARRTAGAFFLLAGTLAAGVRVYVTCIPLELLLGVPILAAILLFVILSLIYTYIGGIKAVVWTDAMQFVLLFGGGIFALCYLPGMIDGGFAGAMKEAKAAGKLHWLEMTFTMSAPYNIWMGVIGGTIFGISTHGADQLIVQRVLACRSQSDGRKALILSAVIILPLFLIFLLVGILLWVFHQHVQPAIPIPESRAGFSQNDYVFPIFILTEIPTGMRGLLLVGILSAAMSSVSSALSALASVSTMDFIKPLAMKKHDEAWLFRFSRRSTVVWGLILVVVAFLTQEVESVLTLAFRLYGLTTGAMLGALLLALWWKRGSSTPLVVGMLGSLATMIVINFRYSEQIHWPWYTLIGTVVCLVLASLCLVLMTGIRARQRRLETGQK